MINLKYTQIQFNKFITQHDYQNEMIKLKIAHMIRVMEINKKFAKWQNLDNENIELAGTIGLLHDIGRFPQVEKYHTFIDSKSIDHCQAGIDLLFKENLITYFVKDKKYYYIIEKAIGNHGKFEIEPHLDENTLLHCKLIRDSDKTDIFEVMLRENPYTVFDGSYDPNASINPAVLKSFYNNSMIKKSDVITVVDDYVRKVAFIFNYYFTKNLKYIKEQNYINKMTEKFTNSFSFVNKQTLQHINEIKEYGNNYITEKLNTK